MIQILTVLTVGSLMGGIVEQSREHQETPRPHIEIATRCVFNALNVTAVAIPRVVGSPHRDSQLLTPTEDPMGLFFALGQISDWRPTDNAVQSS